MEKIVIDQLCVDLEKIAVWFESDFLEHHKCAAVIRAAIKELKIEKKQEQENKEFLEGWNDAIDAMEAIKNKFTQAKKPWIGLTDDEILHAAYNTNGSAEHYALAIERVLKQKNA